MQSDEQEADKRRERLDGALYDLRLAAPGSPHKIGASILELFIREWNAVAKQCGWPERELPEGNVSDTIATLMLEPFAACIRPQAPLTDDQACALAGALSFLRAYIDLTCDRDRNWEEFIPWNPSRWEESPGGVTHDFVTVLACMINTMGLDRPPTDAEVRDCLRTEFDIDHTGNLPGLVVAIWAWGQPNAVTLWDQAMTRARQIRWATTSAAAVSPAEPGVKKASDKLREFDRAANILQGFSMCDAHETTEAGFFENLWIQVCCHRGTPALDAFSEAFTEVAGTFGWHVPELESALRDARSLLRTGLSRQVHRVLSPRLLEPLFLDRPIGKEEALALYGCASWIAMFVDVVSAHWNEQRYFSHVDDPWSLSRWSRKSTSGSDCVPDPITSVVEFVIQGSAKSQKSARATIVDRLRKGGLRRHEVPEWIIARWAVQEGSDGVVWNEAVSRVFKDEERVRAD